jgi:hypothetical protein
LDHLVQRFRQTVAHRFLDVRGADWIHQPDGVAGSDSLARLERGQELVHVEMGERDAGEVLLHRPIEGHAEGTAQRVEHGAVDERRSVAGDEAVQTSRRAALDLRTVRFGEMPERRIGAACQIGFACEGQRSAKLVEVLRIAERRVLVEPLRRKELGGTPLGFLGILEPDARAHEGLRRLGKRHHAEAKRHAQPHVPFVHLEFLDGEFHVNPSPARPWL